MFVSLHDEVCGSGRFTRWLIRETGLFVMWASHITARRGFRSISAGEAGDAGLKNRWLKSLLDSGSCAAFAVIDSGEGISWREAERNWIALYRKAGHLFNVSEGGAGEEEKPFSPGHRANISISAKRRGMPPSTPERRAKQSAALKGKPWSPERRAANEARPPGWKPTLRKPPEERKKYPPISEETRERLRVAHLGYSHSAETRARLSAAMTPEVRAQISAKNTGRKMSAEARARISAALRVRERRPETYVKVAAANRGKRKSDEARAKMSVAKSGKPWSAARRAAFERGSQKHSQACSDQQDTNVFTAGAEPGKSQSFARALLILGVQKPLRILCARELQRSIQDSVHHLLEEQIKSLNLGGHYLVQKANIVGTNGTEFIFAGLKHNINAIKSLEGADVVWIEESSVVSAHSLRTLIPTVRKAASEIWLSYNPEFETDAVHQMFVVKDPPPDSIVRKVNYDENPWFPEVLRREMEHCRATDPDQFNHVWLGHTINVLKGAIYEHEMRQVEAEGRITKVPYDATRPVHTAWDLGWADNTSIWFVQAFPFEYRVIDYVDGSQQPLKHYLNILQGKGYVYGTHFLPHDARAKSLGTGRSVERADAGGRPEGANSPDAFDCRRNQRSPHHISAVLVRCREMCGRTAVLEALPIRRN